MKIVQHYMTNNDCYKAGRKIKPAGIVVHSTGANNPNLKRYIGPDDGVLGKNKYDNHWNKPGISKCVHGFIGKAADGTVMVYQTLPWEHRAWGVGSGEKGSYNDTHIQFEICEDNLEDAAYFKEAFDIAAELCAYLCKEYNLPVSSVVGHYEAHAAGYGNNHGDPRNWQKKHGDSMDAFRARVTALKAGVKVESTVAAKEPQKEAAAHTIYTVKKGDTLWRIANNQLGNGNKYTLIQSANGLNGTMIKAGQQLKIPKG